MKAESVVAAIILVTLFALTGACEIAKWRECRRYHPVWYCLDSK